MSMRDLNLAEATSCRKGCRTEKELSDNSRPVADLVNDRSWDVGLHDLGDLVTDSTCAKAAMRSLGRGGDQTVGLVIHKVACTLQTGTLSRLTMSPIQPDENAGSMVSEAAAQAYPNLETPCSLTNCSLRSLAERRRSGSCYWMRPLHSE